MQIVNASATCVVSQRYKGECEQAYREAVGNVLWHEITDVYCPCTRTDTRCPRQISELWRAVGTPEKSH